ncbi:helix-turn-helix domain-containing protein [Amycolatopsis sp. NPDC049868]|uniref:helix-turn-helix domain-containing protein n=1 Tax=Amycolatopsis sp. NPDC049868 TaxID=3363934 RepID=UPI00379BD64D
MRKDISTIKRRELGSELRRIRKRAGYLATNMASILSWGEPAISHLENGTRKLQDGRIALYLARAKATTEEFDRLVALDRHPDNGYQVRPHPAGIPDILPAITLLDAESTSYSTYDAVDIPRHLQIEPYIHTTLGKHGCSRGTALDAAAQARLTGNPSSTQKPGPFIFYIPESALLASLENPVTACEQLVHLILLSSLPRCHIHLVPAGAPVADLGTGFTLYQHEDHPSVVHHQLPTASLFFEREHDIAYYERQLDQLAELSLGRRETREWLSRTQADAERRLVEAQPIGPSRCVAGTAAGT